MIDELIMVVNKKWNNPFTVEYFNAKKISLVLKKYHIIENRRLIFGISKILAKLYTGCLYKLSRTNLV